VPVLSCAAGWRVSCELTVTGRWCAHGRQRVVAGFAASAVRARVVVAAQQDDEADGASPRSLSSSQSTPGGRRTSGCSGRRCSPPLNRRISQN